MTQGIVVLAATSRPEVLTRPCCVREGSTGRSPSAANPAERAAILVVHCRGKQLGPDVDLNCGPGTPGFSGADLANLANEATIFAVRRTTEIISAPTSTTRTGSSGRREGSNVLLPEEKHAVAVHESGHAIVLALSDHADPVAKVTIFRPGRRSASPSSCRSIERHCTARIT